MKFCGKSFMSTCEWCGQRDVNCDVLLYGDEEAMIICTTCSESLEKFLEKIGKKAAEV